MAYFICVATGMADCTPNDQQYHRAETRKELSAIVNQCCAEWVAEYSDRPTDDTRGDEYYRYGFVPPRDGEDNYSQRLLIGGSDDWVLDVIGMTEDEYNRESEDLT